MRATLDWSMLVETSLDLLVWVTLDLPVLLSLDGQCRPVSASKGIPGQVAAGDLRMVNTVKKTSFTIVYTQHILGVF